MTVNKPEQCKKVGLDYYEKNVICPRCHKSVRPSYPLVHFEYYEETVTCMCGEPIKIVYRR